MTKHVTGYKNGEAELRPSSFFSTSRPPCPLFLSDSTFKVRHGRALSLDCLGSKTNAVRCTTSFLSLCCLRPSLAKASTGTRLVLDTEVRGFVPSFGLRGRASHAHKKCEGKPRKTASASHPGRCHQYQKWISGWLLLLVDDDLLALVRDRAAQQRPVARKKCTPSPPPPTPTRKM